MSKKVVYTMMPVKDSEDDFDLRLTQAKLKTVIEEAFICSGHAESFAVVHSSKFPFPLGKPHILNLRDDNFFGPDEDMNRVVWEMEELFNQPKREIEKQEEIFQKKLEDPDKELVEIFLDYHPLGRKALDAYQEALFAVKEYWQWQSANGTLEELVRYGPNHVREKLIKAFRILGDQSCYRLMRDVDITQEAAQEFSGKGDKNSWAWICSILRDGFRGWVFDNLAPLYNSCGSAMYDGFYLARITGVSHGLDLERVFGHPSMPSPPMPYQVIG